MNNFNFINLAGWYHVWIRYNNNQQPVLVAIVRDHAAALKIVDLLERDVGGAMVYFVLSGEEQRVSE